MYSDVPVNRAYIFLLPVHIPISCIRKLWILIFCQHISISIGVLPDHIIPVHKTDRELLKVLRHSFQIQQGRIIHRNSLCLFGHAIHSSISVIYKIVVADSTLCFSCHSSGGLYITVQIQIRAYITASHIFCASCHTAYISVSAHTA